MNFDGSYRRLGELNVSLIKDLVLQLTNEHWSLNDVRQKRYEVHKSTQAINLVYDEDFRHMKPTVHEAYDLFAPVLYPIFNMITDYYESSEEILAKFGKPVKGYFIRVNLVNLKAGGSIDEHRDMNFSLAHSHRVHLPIVTNPDVIFKVGSEELHMKEGEVYEINNRRLHSVVNAGQADRVHLILDWVFPWEPCCCSQKVHPGQPCTPQACLEIDRMKIPCHCYPEVH